MAAPEPHLPSGWEITPQSGRGDGPGAACGSGLAAALVPASVALSPKPRPRRTARGRCAAADAGRSGRGFRPRPSPPGRGGARAHCVPVAGTAGRGDASVRRARADRRGSGAVAGNMWRPVSPRRTRARAPSHGLCQRPPRNRQGSETRVLAHPEMPRPGPCEGPSDPETVPSPPGTFRARVGALHSPQTPSSSDALLNQTLLGRRWVPLRRPPESAFPAHPEDLSSQEQTH